MWFDLSAARGYKDQAYMWFDLSAARGYKDAVQVRETVSRRMTEAQKLVRDWKPTSKLPALLLQ
jgi:hypothetical protein